MSMSPLERRFEMNASATSSLVVFLRKEADEPLPWLNCGDRPELIPLKPIGDDSFPILP